MSPSVKAVQKELHICPHCYPKAKMHLQGYWSEKGKIKWIWRCNGCGTIETYER